jgi:hypothetical protein
MFVAALSGVGLWLVDLYVVDVAVSLHTHCVGPNLCFLDCLVCRRRVAGLGVVWKLVLVRGFPTTVFSFRLVAASVGGEVFCWGFRRLLVGHVFCP